MADFDPDAYLNTDSTPPAFNPDDYLNGGSPSSQIGTQLKRAITDIPSEIGNEASAGWDTIKNSKMSPTGFLTPIETAKSVMGAGRALASPITGTARSVLGHGLTAATIAGGEYGINPIVKALGGKPQHPDPEKLYEKNKEGVDLAMAALPAK